MQNPEQNLNPETREKVFIYVDYRKNKEEIFRCKAVGIIEADELFQKVTGKDPSKDSYIGCIIENKDENKPE